MEVEDPNEEKSCYSEEAFCKLIRQNLGIPFEESEQWDTNFKKSGTLKKHRKISHFGELGSLDEVVTDFDAVEKQEVEPDDQSLSMEDNI